MSDENHRPDADQTLASRPAAKASAEAGDTVRVAVPEDDAEGIEETPAAGTRVPAARPARSAQRRPAEPAKSRGWFSDDEKKTKRAAAADEADEPGWLDRLSQTLTDLAADISSITVRTYAAEDVGAAVENHREIGEVGELRAWTRIAIDGDTDVCVPLRKGKVDQALWSLHQSVVEQAQTHRSEMIKALIDSVSGLWTTKK